MPGLGVVVEAESNLNHMNIRETNFLGSKIILIHVHKPIPFLAICSSAGESLSYLSFFYLFFFFPYCCCIVY